MARGSALCFSVLVLSCAGFWGASVAEGRLEAAAAGECSVADRGAKCDNATDDRLALQAALDDPRCGVVVVPAPLRCVSRQLNISKMSGRALRIEAGAALVLWRDPKTFAIDGKTKVGPFLWSEPLLSQFSIGGGGAIVGGGKAWWPYGKTIARPETLRVGNGNGVHISNLTIVDSPSWNIAFRGHNAVIEHMNISAGADGCGGYGEAPNTDGFNVAGSNITVRYSTVHNGDDCIPVTSLSATEPTDGVYVHDISCHCGTNGGVIFSSTGTVRNVHFDRITVNGTNQGLGVKIAEAYYNATGGLVENVTWSNIDITGPRYAAVYANMYAEDAVHCSPPSDPHKNPRWLTVRNLHAINVTAKLIVPEQRAGCFLCTPDDPCDDWTFDNVTVKGSDGEAAPPYACHNVEHLQAIGGTSPVPCSA